MTEYIYESPDGGKTVYRRKFGDYDNRELVHTTEGDERIAEREKVIKEHAEILNAKLKEIDRKWEAQQTGVHN